MVIRFPTPRGISNQYRTILAGPTRSKRRRLVATSMGQPTIASVECADRQKFGKRLSITPQPALRPTIRKRASSSTATTAT